MLCPCDPCPSSAWARGNYWLGSLFWGSYSDITESLVKKLSNDSGMFGQLIGNEPEIGFLVRSRHWPRWAQCLKQARGIPRHARQEPNTGSWASTNPVSPVMLGFGLGVCREGLGSARDIDPGLPWFSVIPRHPQALSAGSRTWDPWLALTRDSAFAGLWSRSCPSRPLPRQGSIPFTGFLARLDLLSHLLYISNIFKYNIENHK